MREKAPTAKRCSGCGHAIACALLAVFAAGGAAHAEPIGTVVVEAARPDRRADPRTLEDQSLPLVTIVDARAAGAGQTSVADLLAAEAGVRIRSRGGLGAFTSVSLRGSEEGEVAVFLDGVPLSRAASGALDLSQLPADGLERIEIYRGAPPVELGGEAIGGVINLVSRRAGRRMSFGAEVGGGSFAARSIAGYVGGPVAAARKASDNFTAQASGAYRGATGDFSYFDNGGTLFYTGDDRVSIRRNNDVDQANLDVTLDRAGARPLHLGVHGFWKNQGVPGAATLGKETEHARLTNGRLLISGSASRRGRVDLRVQASLLYERNHFENPFGEDAGPFGPSVTDGEAVSASLVPRVVIPLGHSQLLTALAEARLEHRQAYDLLKPSAITRPAFRGLGALAIADEASLLHDQLSIYGGLRLDLRGSALLTNSDGVALPDQDSFDWFVSPRLNLKWRAHPVVTLRGSAGRYVRFPTLLEQFGDGAFILGRPTLRPESAWGGDVAVTVRGKLRHVSGGIETSFFGRRTTDLIVFLPGGNTYTAVNVGEAQVLGLEARGDVTVAGIAQLQLGYTFLDARDVTDGAASHGLRLPGRAPQALDVRLTVIAGPVRVGYELDYLAAVPRDALNLNELPARLLHGLSAWLRAGRFELGVEVRNLADTRIVPIALGGSARTGETAPYPLVDFYNFPLPGRAFYATARFTQ